MHCRAAFLVSALAAAMVSACFVGYDSRWGQAKQAQRRVAASAAPETISPAESRHPAPGRAERTFHVRVLPDPRYLAQTIDAPKQIADLVDRANGVMLPALSLQLVVDHIDPWSNDEDENMDAALRALAATDTGSDADLVIGMVGALPRRTESLHEAGVAELLGKHIVLRAASRLGERDSIERSLNELSEDERTRLLKLRQGHRALAVLLHEIGHCLGAIHESDPGNLMNPTYDPKMSEFGEDALALMRATLDEPDRAAVARAQLAILRDEGRHSGSQVWVAGERDDAIERLEGMLRTAARGHDARAARAGDGRAAAGAPHGEFAPPSDLPQEARDRLARAVALFGQGGLALAYDTASPLFPAYPDVPAIQDLRCQLATLRRLDRAEVLTECAPYMRLTSAADAGADAAAR